ncbi:hypothetical protein Y032_0848g2670 [Ancylostoma ceylanicum]|nr:hypothetical protein Y032_0848g2670 [Ancylostoma ceylanicum]
MDRLRILLDADVKDLEHYLAMAENSLCQAPKILTSDQVAEMFRKEMDIIASKMEGPSSSDFEMLQTKLNEQSAEMKRLKEKIMAMEEPSARDVQGDNDVLVNVTPEKVQRRLSEQKIQVEQMEDQEYWARMVQEVSGPELPALVSEPSSDDESEPEVKTRKVRVQPEESDRVEELAALLWQMERDFESFPFRKREEFSPGIEPDIKCAFCGIYGEHFSDSCPRIQNGDTRFDIIRGRLLCVYCLEDCPKDCPSSSTCNYKRRQCWYCNRVKGTMFEDLIPRDNGHHRSLCNVPDKKHIAMVRITSAKRELAELQRKGPDGDKDNNARSEE